MFTHIVIAVDGPESGADAVALARELADGEAAFTLVHVDCSEPYPWRGYNADFDAQERAAARDLLGEVRAQAGIRAELTVLDAPRVGRALADLASRIGADLIAVGAPRHGRLSRLLGGDTGPGLLEG